MYMAVVLVGAAEHSPGAREVDERDGESAEEAGEAREGDGLLHRVHCAAEEEPVRHHRAHRAAACRHAGNDAHRPVHMSINHRILISLLIVTLFLAN